MAQPNQTVQINGLTFISRTCQYNGICQNFNEQLTIPVANTVRGVQVGATEKLNTCMFGGGCACEDFVKLIEMERY